MSTSAAILRAPNASKGTVGDGAAVPAWHDGWMDGVRRCPSPNFNERPPGTVVDLALIHSISLPPGEYGGDAIERLFTNRLEWDAHPYFAAIRGLEVSAHFLIRRTGECVQFVSCDERAWHAGPSVWKARPQCNDFSIGIELEGLEDMSFESAQYDSLASLLHALADRYPILDVAGHEHVAPGRKRDPGSGFDWHRLQALSGWLAERFAGVSEAPPAAS